MTFNVKEIVSAWASKVKPKRDQKRLAEKRATICSTCDRVKEAIGSVDGTRYCAECGCLLEAKVYSYREGACPLGKWDTVDREFRNTKALKVLKNIKSPLV